MRIDRQTAIAAGRFDANLGVRLRDGTVSDVDLQAAQQIYQNVINNRPQALPNQWGVPQHNQYAVNKWERDLGEAQYIYAAVSQAYQSQNPQVTAMETQKDLMNQNGGGWSNQPNYGYQPSVPNYGYQPSVPQYGYGGYPPSYPTYPQQGGNKGAAIAIGILVGLGAFEAIRNMR